ncbi:MAG: DUF2321 domain-containing protein [Nitrospirota bacterium]
MTKIEELKMNTEALFHSVNENKKFFSSIYRYVEELHSLLTVKLHEAKKEEIQFLANKIEDFFQGYRPRYTPGVLYVPPRETSTNDKTVKEIFRLSKEVGDADLRRVGQNVNAEGYDIAQICLDGHIINDATQSFPEINKKFCNKCGEETIDSCPSCKNPIQGRYHGGGSEEYIPPSYCHNCGAAFPWIESKIKAAIELSIEDGNLNEEESKNLEESINNIVKDTPRTQVAASRFKKIMTKIGTSTAEGIKTIIVDIVSETAKKIIWPDK